MTERDHQAGNESQIPLGAYTLALRDLLRAEGKDAEWEGKVSTLLAVAPLRYDAEKPFFVGPDGLAYLSVWWPPMEGEFSGFVLKDSLDILVGANAGMVIHNEAGEVELVVPPGDILSYKLYGKRDFLFEGIWSQPSLPEAYQDLDQLMVGIPSDEMFPKEVASALLPLLTSLYSRIYPTSKREPMVALIRPGIYTQDDRLPSDLIFNFFQSDFSNLNDYKWAVSAVTHYLPRCLRVRTVFLNDPAFTMDRFTSLQDIINGTEVK